MLQLHYELPRFQIESASSVGAVVTAVNVDTGARRRRGRSRRGRRRRKALLARGRCSIMYWLMMLAYNI